jgi:hypothetical protein
MDAQTRKAWLLFPILILVGALFAWAGSQGGAFLGSLPVYALAAAAIFLIQWLVFIPSFLSQTEKYFDLTGSLTYISVTLFLVLVSGERDASPPLDARSYLLAALVLVWAGGWGRSCFAASKKPARTIASTSSSHLSSAS